jgi:hypothetical protein
MSFFDDLWEAIKSVFSPAPAAAPVTACPPGALTPAQAQAWFDRFRARQDIPWNYPNDCCYNRAHVMAQELQASGVNVGKAWNYAPAAGGPLRVATPNDPRGYVEWGYHVAPTVPVCGTDGVTRPMVIDPSIASGPVSPEQWKAMQGQPGSDLVLTDASPYYRREDGAVAPTPSDAQVQDIFEQHREARAANWSTK